MSTFLLVCLRSGEIASEVARAEERDFLVASGLAPEDLDVVVLQDTQTTLPDLSAYAGVFVGGSSLNIRTPQWSPWQRHVHSQLDILIGAHIPTLLICYGTSWLAHVTGGKIGTSHAEKTGPTLVELTAEGQLDPLCQALPHRFSSLTGHTENVAELGPEVTVLAQGPTCPVQIIRYRENVWATQFHADMDAQAMRTRMDFYMDYGYFTREEYAGIVASLPSIDTTWSNQLLRNFVTVCAGARAL